MSKKQPNHSTLSLRSMPRDRLEQFAAKSIEEGKLRTARDAYKELTRIDRDRFLPELLRCYNMLAGKMAENGQMEEARNMVSYIRELGGEKAVTVNLDLVRRNGKPVDVSITALAGLIAAGGEIPREVKYRAADAMIAAEELPEGGIPEMIFAENIAVKKALEAVCNGDFEKAIGALRPIPYDSFFSQWKLLLRGMCHYYGGNDGKATAAFEKVAPLTVPAKCARVFLTAIDRKKYLTNEDSDREEVLKNLCIMTGRQRLADILPRAQYLWMTGRYRDSMHHVMREMPGFPSLDDGIAGTLTTLYFNIFHHLDDNRADRFLDLFERFFDRYDRYTVAHLLAHRAISLHAASCIDIPDAELIEMWELFMTMHRKIFGPDNELDAEVYLFLGLRLGAGRPSSDPFKELFTGKKSPSSSAEKCLKKAMTLSKSRDACLALLNYYRSVKRDRECRRIVEEALNAFPGDKELLREAGIMALNREAVYKGVEYLERALRLDPLDSALREALTIGCINAARTASKAVNGAGKMRRYIERAENLCPAAGKGFNNEPCYMAMRRAAFEFCMGNEREGSEQFKRSYVMTADRAMLSCFGFFLFKIYRVPPPCGARLDAEVHGWFDSPPVVERAVSFIRVLGYAHMFKEPTAARNEEGRCLDYVIGALKSATFTPGDIRLFFEYATGRKLMKSARKIASIALAAEPGNPLYRFFSCMTKLVEPQFLPRYKLEKELKKMRAILGDAKKCGDTETASMAEREIGRVEPLLHRPFGFPLPFDFPPPDFDVDGERFEGEREDFFPRRDRSKRKRGAPRLETVKHAAAEQMDLFGGNQS